MRSHIPVVPGNLKDRRASSLWMGLSKRPVSFALASLCLLYYLHTNHPCASCSWKSHPTATVTQGQAIFSSQASWALKYVMLSIPERTKRSTLSKFIFKPMCLLSAVANRHSVPGVLWLEPINTNRWIAGPAPYRLLLLYFFHLI